MVFRPITTITFYLLEHRLEVTTCANEMLNILVVADKQVRLTVEFIPFLCSIAPLTEVMLGLLPMSLGFLEHYKNN